MARHTFNTLMQRLNHAGFKAEFVRTAILPEWWEDPCAQDAALLPEVEVRVARFLTESVAVVRDPNAPLAAPRNSGVQLRRVRRARRGRLTPAIHTALQIAGAVVRSIRDPEREVRLPPGDARAWRDELTRADAVVRLPDIAADLWARGIPVVPLGVLPSPSFQGLACFIAGRPVVLLGQAYDEPSRLAFFIVHEVGHIEAGDCAPGRPVVDEQDEVVDDEAMERSADAYATDVLVGGFDVVNVAAGSFKDLARKAVQIEKESAVDAAAVIWSWARRTGKFGPATLAVKALYRTIGGRRHLREHFDRHVDVDAAAESDRALLRCVYGEPERDAAAP